MALQVLPNEIILKIFSNLLNDSRQIYMLLQVSKSWARVAWNLLEQKVRNWRGFTIEALGVANLWAVCGVITPRVNVLGAIEEFWSWANEREFCLRLVGLLLPVQKDFVFLLTGLISVVQNLRKHNSFETVIIDLDYHEDYVLTNDFLRAIIQPFSSDVKHLKFITKERMIVATRNIRDALCRFYELLLLETLDVSYMIMEQIAGKADFRCTLCTLSSLKTLVVHYPGFWPRFDHVGYVAAYFLDCRDPNTHNVDEYDSKELFIGIDFDGRKMWWMTGDVAGSYLQGMVNEILMGAVLKSAGPFSTYTADHLNKNQHDLLTIKNDFASVSIGLMSSI